jgi:hypothetical protein
MLAVDTPASFATSASVGAVIFVIAGFVRSGVTQGKIFPILEM